MLNILPVNNKEFFYVRHNVDLVGILNPIPASANLYITSMQHLYKIVQNPTNTLLISMASTIVHISEWELTADVLPNENPIEYIVKRI